ncbi:MarR family transcriptional regulator [Olivibacter sp. SDN3]|uniref:MarR family winged helix-turn-helix transcriptional regulator n=1 Tax=Olivibacter sp. SDN3 TaxID=2764720 RepID=UPI001650D95D|nr:MarR family transcriptional regulator [Olivibacter sp. SDN3]QNL48531.1 MarR family transcriptional regulator [Olivibacter sp. SDN3]
MGKFIFRERELVDFLTGKTNTAINRRLIRNFKTANLEITIEQWTVLNVLWDKDGQSQQELSNSTFRDKPSITRLIDNLEKQNLVVRIPDKADRRTNLVFLTHKAKKLKEPTLQEAKKTMEEALIGVTEIQLDTCREVLAKIFDNLK